MRKITLQQISVLVALIATLVVNTLANSIPLNGMTQAEISDQFEVYFVPAGYVFSIWGLIYLGLIAYGIFQILPSNSDSSNLRSIGWLYVGTCIANIVWIFVWHYAQYVWSIIIMLSLLVLLILIYERLWQARNLASRAEFWSVHIPFSVYLGWITVATVANATTVLDFVGWGGWGIPDVIWAVIMLVIATAIGLLVVFRRNDPAYGLVLVWAFVGIARKHMGTFSLEITAWITASIMILFVLYQWMKSRRSVAS